VPVERERLGRAIVSRGETSNSGLAEGLGLTGPLMEGFDRVPTSFGQKTRPGRYPEPEIIALPTLMINQAREVFCQGRFPASLIYVLIENRCPVDSYAASLS
jgi:hypothetical protein